MLRPSTYPGGMVFGITERLALSKSNSKEGCRSNSKGSARGNLEDYDSNAGHSAAAYSSQASGEECRGAFKQKATDVRSAQSAEVRALSRDQRLEEVITSIREESRRYSGSAARKLWEDKDGAVVWPWYRILLSRILMSQRFEAMMGVIIMTNVVFIVLESNSEAGCYPDFYDPVADSISECPTASQNVWWLVMSNSVFLAVYTVEGIMGLLAFRGTYFSNKWNCLDFFVVCTGILSEIVSGMVNVAYMRILRIARLMRAFRIVLSIRELYMLISGLGSSLKAMFFGMILLFGMLAVWGIILVEFVHPVNAFIDHTGCERCGRAYSTVEHTTLTLFQSIVAGDSWGSYAVPVIEEKPLLAIFLMLTVITVALCVMNLILAVIVESAAEARENDMAEKTRQKQKVLLEQKIKLLRLCAQMDEDASSSISMDELMGAWEANPEFRAVMVSLEVQREDLTTVFGLLDVHGSGDVDYKEFVDQLYQLSTCDMRMMIALLRTDLEAVKSTVQAISKAQAAAVDQEHAKTLREHSEILKEMRSDMQLLIKIVAPHAARDANHSAQENVGASLPKLAAADEEMMLGFISDLSGGGSTLSCLSEPQCEPREPNMVETVADVANLRQQLQELVDAKIGIMSKAEQQEAMLMNHAEVLSTVQAALLDPSGDAKTHSKLVQDVAKQVGRLRQHIRFRLRPSLQELSKRVDDEAVIMQGSGQIIDSVTSKLKIPPPPPHPAAMRASSRRRQISAASVDPAEAAPPPEVNRPAPFPSQTGPASRFSSKTRFSSQDSRLSDPTSI